MLSPKLPRCLPRGSIRRRRRPDITEVCGRMSIEECRPRNSVTPRLWWPHLGIHVELGFQDITRRKRKMDAMLRARSFEAWRSVVLKFSGDLSVVSTGGISPSYDVTCDNDLLQDHTDENLELEGLWLSMSLMDQGFAVVLGWDGSSTPVTTYVEACWTVNPAGWDMCWAQLMLCPSREHLLLPKMVGLVEALRSGACGVAGGAARCLFRPRSYDS